MSDKTVLRFAVLPDGTLAEQPFTPPAAPAPSAAPAPAWAATPPENEDEDEDMPDEVSASFDELRAALAAPAAQAESATSCAEFALYSDGTAALLSWPRCAATALLPQKIMGHSLTAIAPLAFAPMQLTEGCPWQGLYASPISFSIFCMRSASALRYTGGGSGPASIVIPETVEEIGAFAFLRCTRLKALALPPRVRRLGAGTFAECCCLEALSLPQQLEELGLYLPDNAQTMPDIGVFNGCAALKSLVLPQALTTIGAQVFNSCGLQTLAVQDAGGAHWQREIALHPTAFDHTPSLEWMEKRAPGGDTVWRIGLPAARDKILRSDPRFGALADLPRLFFSGTPQALDETAFAAARLDFLGRMAAARLSCPALLDAETAVRYLDFLAENYPLAEQFWPKTPGKSPWEQIFDLMAASPHFTAGQLNCLLRSAGALYLPAELIARMIETRNRRFATVTGFEDLEL